MQFSLVMATRNRPMLVQRFLSSIDLAHSDAELIVVDQSDEGERANLRKIISSSANLGRIRYFESAGRGLSFARNEGLSKVTGRFVGFPDDDCEYPSSLLDTVALKFSRFKPGFLVGSYFERTGKHPVAGEVVPITSWNAFKYVNSITLFIDLSVLEKRQLWFEEHLGAGTNRPLGEETDLALRLLRCGVAGKWFSDVYAFHPPTKMGERLRNAPQIDEAYGYLIGLNCQSPSVLVRGLLGMSKLAVLVFLRKAEPSALNYRVRGLLLGLRERGRDRRPQSRP